MSRRPQRLSANELPEFIDEDVKNLHSTNDFDETSIVDNRLPLL